MPFADNLVGLTRLYEQLHQFMPSSKIARTNVLGVGVSALNLATTIQVIDQWIEARTPHYVCVTGVHGIMESQSDAVLREIHNRAGLVTPDGMPLVWLSRMAGQPETDRVYGPDLMFAFCEHSVAKHYRHFLYGSSDAVLAQLEHNLCTRIPGLTIVGSYSPPFRPLTEAEDQQIVDDINGTHPDVVWVGLSTPKQEKWMAAHVDKVQAPALIGVGAAFDFHAGTKWQAPYWMQRNGLEWFFRLVTEPRRLWKRYLYNNPRFIYAVCLQKIGLRNYSI